MGLIRSQHLLVVVLVGIVLGACSFGPLRLFGADAKDAEPPIALKRCEEVQDVLCLITFGLQPPDQMLIALMTMPELPSPLELVLTRLDEQIEFACEATEVAPNIVYCIGPQVPLGSSVQIEVFAGEERALLARGEFTIMALALPTVSTGGDFPTLPALPTPRSTRTPLAGTAYPNLSPSQTPDN